MTFEQLSQYFEALATSSVDIAHTPEKKRFFKVDIDDLLSGIYSFTGMGLFVENFEGKITIPSMDNIHNEKKICINILMPLKNQSNTEEKNNVYNACEAVGNKILSKIIYDKMNQHDVAIYLGTSITYYRVGPIANSLYGVSFDIPFLFNNNFKYQQSDWI